MAQWVKSAYSAYTRDLSLNPQHPYKKLGMATCAYNHNTGRQRWVDPESF